MKIKIIAAVARNGVMGRTKKPCPDCGGRGVTGRDEYDRWPCRCLYAENGVAGYVPANDLPWPPIKEDMVFFKRETMGHAVVMGRLTKESIPSKFFPLEGRTNIVVSSTPDGKYVLPSLESALVHAECLGHDTLFVIGGALLFAEALPIADELVLTLIDKYYEGDVKFPFGRGFTPDMDCGSTHRLSNPAEAYDLTFECIERRQGETPELTFTRWVRR